MRNRCNGSKFLDMASEPPALDLGRMAKRASFTMLKVAHLCSELAPTPG